jgi:hypothetical protein
MPLALSVAANRDDSTSPISRPSGEITSDWQW